MNLKKKLTGGTILGILVLGILLMRLFVFTLPDGRTRFQHLTSDVSSAASSAYVRNALNIIKSPSEFSSGTYVATKHTDHDGLLFLRLQVVSSGGTGFTGVMSIYYMTTTASNVRYLHGNVSLIADGGTVQFTDTDGSVYMGTYKDGVLSVDNLTFHYMSEQESDKAFQQAALEGDQEARGEQHDADEEAKLAAIVAANAPNKIPDGTYIAEINDNGYYQAVVSGSNVTMTEVNLENSTAAFGPPHLESTVSYLALSYPEAHQFSLSGDEEWNTPGTIKSNSWFTIGGCDFRSATPAEIQALRNKIIGG